MKIVVATAAVLLGAAGMASAQDGRKMEELQREFDRAMKGLQQKFDEERSRMEKEFRAARERLMQPQRPAPKGEPPPFEKKSDPQELLQRILERLERLERKLDQQDMPFKNLPKDFDFRRFERELEPFREFAPRWREFMPKFKDEDFRFEFRKKHDGEEKEEKKVEKKKLEKKEDRKEDKGDEKKKY